MLSNTALTSKASTAATVLRSRANADGGAADPEFAGGGETPEGVFICSPICACVASDTRAARALSRKGRWLVTPPGGQFQGCPLAGWECGYRSTASANFTGAVLAPVRLAGLVTDHLDIVAVGVEDERPVVVRRIMRPNPG